MDSLSLLALVAGLVGTTMKRIQIYNDSYDLSVSPSVTIASMMAQCSCVEYALLQVQNTITQSPTSMSLLEMDGALNRHFTTVFGACQMVLSILNERLSHLLSANLSELSEASKKARLNAQWNDQEMKNLLRNIESQASALNLLFVALQMRSNIEIHALITRPKSVLILDRVTDDASSLLSRGDGVTKTLSMKPSQDSESVFDGIDFDFDVELVQSSVYRKALKFSWTRSILRRRLARGTRSRSRSEPTVQVPDHLITEPKALDDRVVNFIQQDQSADTTTIISDWSDGRLEKQDVVLREVEVPEEEEEEEMQLSTAELTPASSATDFSDEASTLNDDQMTEPSSEVEEPESLEERKIELSVERPTEAEKISILSVALDECLSADLKMPSAPRKLRSALKAPGPKVGNKRTPDFNPQVLFYETWSNTEYDRVGESTTSNHLTPDLAEQIKEELNAVKKVCDKAKLAAIKLTVVGNACTSKFKSIYPLVLIM